VWDALMFLPGTVTPTAPKALLRHRPACGSWRPDSELAVELKHLVGWELAELIAFLGLRIMQANSLFAP
jgi:hypothetical protein